MDVGVWLGAALAVTGIAVAIGIAVWQQQRKTIDWAFVTSAPLMSELVANAELSEVQVLWRGQPLAQPRFVLVRVKNTGNKEVTAEDFETPPTIKFKNSTIVEASARGRTESGPFAEAVNLDVDGHQVSTPATLLNKRELFSLRLLVDGPEEEPTFECRFEGWSRPPKQRDLDSQTVIWPGLAAIAGLGALLVVMLIVDPANAGVWTASFMGASTIVFGIDLIWTARSVDKLTADR